MSLRILLLSPLWNFWDPTWNRVRIERRARGASRLRIRHRALYIVRACQKYCPNCHMILILSSLAVGCSGFVLLRTPCVLDYSTILVLAFAMANLRILALARVPPGMSQSYTNKKTLLIVAFPLGSDRALLDSSRDETPSDPPQVDRFATSTSFDSHKDYWLRNESAPRRTRSTRTARTPFTLEKEFPLCAKQTSIDRASPANTNNSTYKIERS